MKRKRERCTSGRRSGWRLTLLLSLLILPWLTATASARGCFPVAGPEPRVQPAAYRLAQALPEGSVRLTFLGHASFLIETPGGATAVTDYNGWLRPPMVPKVVTMNNAHDTHYTDFLDPEIQHVLRGWNPDGGTAEHDIVVDDLRVRNVPTAVHGRYGSNALSNSMFVFEVGDLCIAHLGHLHHLLTDEQLGELGQIDVALVPIDGLYTMGQELMIQVIEQIRPSIVVPMHYFGPTVLSRFLKLAEASWRVVTSPEASIVISRPTLPERTVLVLPGH